MRKYFRSSLYFSGLLFIVFTSFSYASESSKKVIVPSGIDWQPHSYLTENQELTGNDVELLKTVLNKMGYSLTYAKLPLKRLLINKSGQDVNANFATTYTPERAQLYHFSLPYRKERIAIYYVDSKFDGLTSLNELFQTADSISLNIAGYYGDDFEKLSKKYAFKLAHNETAARRLKQLALKRVELVIGDLDNTDHLISKYEYKDIKRSSVLVVEQDVAFAFKKSSFDKLFIYEFNNHLQEVLK